MQLSQRLRNSVSIGTARLAITALKLRNRPRKMLQHPHPILDKVAKPVTNFDKKKLTLLFRQLTAALNNQIYGDKLGIAAPQIGISKRVILVLGVPMINPTWNPVKGVTETTIEACYSLGFGDMYKVERPKYGWAKWFDINGNEHEMKLTGLRAIVFQHELDHLDGKCCHKTGELMPKPDESKTDK